MSRKHIDMSGQRFGMLLALERVADQSAQVVYRCKCDCGNESTHSANNLRSGSATSCGCKKTRKRGGDWGRQAECAFCGASFFAARRPERPTGFQQFCSTRCGYDAKRVPQVGCRNCGNAFWPQSRITSGNSQAYCCLACEREHAVGPNSPAWRGGVHLQADGKVAAYVGQRDGYATKRTGYHRVVCAKALGRWLTRNETVIHLNGDHSDNRPENLFICASHGEMSQRHNGKLPWPSASNLNEWAGLRNC